MYQKENQLACNRQVGFLFDSTIGAISIANALLSIENDTNTSETNNSNIEADPSNNQIKEESIHLSSGSEAIQYLAKELEMENNEDIIFDDMGGSLEEDAQGSYYTITLYSKELKEAGGSGTLESYKVYQNGKYELQ